MKVGDTIPVTIAGETVAMAQVKEMDNDTATLVVPATLVVMGIRTELDAGRTADTEGTHQLLGVEDEAAPVVESPEAPETPVAQETPVDQAEENNE